MIPKQAIEKAIEGGWEDRAANVLEEAGLHSFGDGIWQQVALDPTFWQALGKALGWKYLSNAGIVISWGWEHYANRFYYLILTGGDTEAFWKELLAPLTDRSK